MHVFYFASRSDWLAGNLRDLIESAAPGNGITRYGSAEELAAGLRATRPGGLDLAVLLCANRADLRNLLGITSLLGDMARIVILPDRAAETVAQGLKLLPNFFSYRDANLADVGSVFEKILQKIAKPRVAAPELP